MNNGLTDKQKIDITSAPMNINPYWPSLLPYCSDSDCPMYDGKRCQLLGSTPDSFCEPALKEIVLLIGDL